MKRIKRIGKYTGFLLSGLILMQFSALSQPSSVMYYMPNVPQSHQLNPATQPRCGFYLGLPGLSPFQVNVENSAFGLKDIFFMSGDSLIHPLHPDAEFADFFDNFGKSNYVSTDVSTNIASYGYRAGNMYQSFDITQRIFTRFAYPRDLIDFAYYGNSRGDEFDFSGFGVNLMSYLEFAMGVSHKLNDVFTIGYRGKLLFGQANISTKKTNITLMTDEVWTAHSQFEVNASLPFVTIETNDDGQFKFDDIETDDEINASKAIDAVTGNFGLGLDLGIHVKPIDKLTLSASILDLGYIRWKSFTYNISQNADFVFDGIETIINDTSDRKFGELLLDSLENTFTLNNTQTAYTTFLPAKVYLGAKYDIIPEIGVSILSRTEIFKGRLREQLNLSVNFYPLKMVSATFNYAIMNRTFNNFGMGLALKAGPFNWYLISDNIPLVYARDKSSGVLIPYTARSVNFRVGFNLVFACRGGKKAFRDRPLIY